MVVESGFMVRKILLKFEVYFKSGFLRMTLSKESSNDWDLPDWQGPLPDSPSGIGGQDSKAKRVWPVTWLVLCIHGLATDASSLHMECERANSAFWRWGEFCYSFITEFMKFCMSPNAQY